MPPRDIPSMTRSNTSALCPAPPRVVTDYDPGWSSRFHGLRSAIRRTLVNLSPRIEHIGGTSVPRLCSLPSIDIDVILPPDTVDLARAKLRARGYLRLAEAGTAPALMDPTATTPHRIYVCSTDGRLLSNHLAVREVLRSDPIATLAYGELKRSLASIYAPTSIAYAEGKTSFLLALLRSQGFAGAMLTPIEPRARQPVARRARQPDRGVPVRGPAGHVHARPWLTSATAFP